MSTHADKAADPQAEINRLKLRIAELEAELVRAHETIESVCTGERILCALCGQPKPCMCDHAPTVNAGKVKGESVADLED